MRPNDFEIRYTTFKNLVCNRENKKGESAVKGLLMAFIKDLQTQINFKILFASPV